MGVRPERNNAQFQPLTIILRNIIKEYPAGGGVLRELCQNADDAGASEVEFVLDRREHKTQDILHDGLAEYQGVSLLAFNNSTFTDVDFDSLSRIGDSAKAKDLSATGKFGRGFNSVYNWTDNPSILSRSSLLILDPHQAWSASPEVGQPGGPLYDFVKYSHEQDMQNQLSAFSSILNDFSSEFNGTIIRIPLRTQAQAAKSKILATGKPTTDTEIIDTFRKFSGELVETLLFLKNLHTITLRVDDNVYAKAVSTTHSFSDAQQSEPFEKAKISAAYRKVFVDQANESCSMNFVMNISLHRSQVGENDETGSNQQFKFAISHHLCQSPTGTDNDLGRWSRSQKLFPWVAIATPLEGYEQFEGRLFSSLPLPIRTQHPVHIHGMFSITPDRNSIHSGGDWTISEDSEARLGTKWNEWLLHDCVPNAWVQNLEFLSILTERKECGFSGWNFWPAGGERGSEKLWMGILSDVFGRVTTQDLELFPTICNIFGKREDILFTLDIPENLMSASQHVGVPIVVPPKDRLGELEKLKPYTIGLKPLEPGSARTCLSKLKDLPAFGALDLDSRVILLHYILSDENFREIGTCTAPLIPLMDGTYVCFDLSTPNAKSIFLPRGDDEVTLFAKYKKMVDTSKIPSKTTKLMRKHINGELQKFTKISVWGIEDVARYCVKYIFNKLGPHDTDIIRKDHLVDFINQLWEWITLNCKPLDLVARSSLKRLFLLPLIDGEYRRLDSTIPVLDVSGNRGIGAFLRSTAISHSQLYGRRYHLFTGDGFSSYVGGSLLMCGFMKDYEDIKPLMTWLTTNRENFVDQLNNGERVLLLQHLNALSRSSLSDEKRRIMGEAVARLSLFREAIPGGNIERPWISLSNRYISYVGVRDVQVQLQAPNTIFIDISDPDTEQIASRLGLVACPQLADLFEKFVIPNFATLDEGLKGSHVEYILWNCYLLSQRSKDALSQLEIVPVQCSPGRILRKRPRDTIAQNPVLATLYFKDECRLPVDEFYRRHCTKLLELGMIDSITSGVALDRILEYGKRGKMGYKLKSIAGKAQQLITHYNNPSLLPQETIQSLQWIPAQLLDKKLTLSSAIGCRDPAREKLVKYIMPLLTFAVSPTWASCFGWDQPLGKHLLLQQLQGAVNSKDNTVLDYLIKSRELETCVMELSKMEWIPGGTGVYYSPSTIFFDDFRILSPHFGTLETRFRGLALFRKLGVQNAPSLDQLKELQDQLSMKGTLEDLDLEKAIFIVVEVGKRFSDDISLFEFKAPDRHGHMRLMSELTAGDPGSAEVDLLILHPKISLDTVKKLGISTFKDRYLERSNDPYFEEEFAQRESPAAVIKDTLKRYPISSTFNEYLANAEDCGNASKVCWVLDSGEDYSKTDLLSPKLAEVQGPALFCYNDGLFTEDDFRGITNIGIGSKARSPCKIGKFGKGALTMYHWTSVPSFISGDYYVIFDPEQKYLPEHPRTKRPRAGMKFKIEYIRSQCPNQLQPFEGILGFDKDSKSFPGTLFRFPLRRTDTFGQSKISIFDVRKYLEEYYHEATTSLLFLKKVSSISFWDKDSKDPVWGVSSKVTTVPDTPHIAYMKINRQFSSGSTSSNYSDKWCIISRNTEDIPQSLVGIQKKERLEAKYGLAALLSEISGDFYGRHFVGLPLQFVGKLGLPVHVNADIIIGSNRQSIPIRESEDGSAWNKWIYEHGIAPLYLDLVAHLMQFGPNGYRYWPGYPSKTLSLNTESVSRTISAVFWELVTSSVSDLYPPMRLSPASTTDSASIPRNLSMKAAIFNFLEPADSVFMLPLLSKLGVENIVTPSETVQNGLKEAQPSLSSITPTYLLNRLRSPPHHQRTLLEIWAQEERYSMDFFNLVLSFITRGTELNLLIDCALLPLANRTLGTFRSKSRNQGFLVPRTPQEQKILEISQDLMVHPSLGHSVLQKLVSSELLNIAWFTFNDIARLCPILEGRDIEYRKTWLLKVWAYLKNYPSHLPRPQLACFEHMPVYFGRIIGEPATGHIFICPSDFETFGHPAILEQSGLAKEALLVLGLFSGLVLLDKSAFPESKSAQESIKTPKGLYRLLKSINMLASKSGLFIEDYITKIVPSNSIKTLRSLFTPTLLSDLFRYPSAKDYLLQFPIWPVMNAQTLVHQPAMKALLPPLAELSSLGMTKSDIFIDTNTARQYSRELDQLGVRKMTIDQFLTVHVGICQGQEIASDKRQNYPQLLKILFSESYDSCSRYPIGVDGDGKFCMLESLYAFDVPVFTAAFRDLERTTFLHPDYRNLEIWQRSPLQKVITQERYLACARSIQRRAAEMQDNLVDDARTVFESLCWDTPDIRSWSSSTWDHLSRIDFVPTRATLAASPEHRRSQMQALSGDTKFTTLIEGILPEHMNVAWSQCPIFYGQPTAFVLSKIPTRGIPSSITVISHLIFLSNNRYEVTKAQIPDYVKDIKAAYMHLLRRLAEYEEEIAFSVDGYDIWFNVEADEANSMSTDEFQKCWVASNNLCLGLEYDSLPLQRIRSFLTPFHELLEYFDIKRLSFPDIPDHTPKIADHNSLVLGGFQRLRSQGRSFDVKLIAQGQVFEAHWSLLSAVSGYWESMFVSGMRETTTRTVEFPEIRPKTIELILDYIYSGGVPAINVLGDVTEELENLIDQLYTADLWQLDNLKTILEIRLCNKHWIRPETVRRVLSCAEDVRAETIAQVCRRYISKNIEIIQREDSDEADD